MKQFFILGASGVYGVGAESDGWADLVKSYVHSKMYGTDGVGEKYEVFNFAKSGSTIEFVAESAPWIYHNYARSDEVATFISVGGNDAKAEYAPDNFVCTPEEFELKLSHLLEILQQYSKQIVFVSNNAVDEIKTNPKQSPFDDNKVSYFTNHRRSQFNSIAKGLCSRKNIEFLATSVDEATWIANYLFSDGLHPNQEGHQKVFEATKPFIDKYLLS